MKESTGALLWITGILIAVICVGLVIRHIKEDLSNTASYDPNAALANQRTQQEHLMKQSELEQKRMQQTSQRDQKRMLQDLDRQLKDNQRRMKAH